MTHAEEHTEEKTGGFLALELDGAGYQNLGRAVLAAESAGFHVATFADAPAPGRVNALQRAAFAGPVTRTIVVVPEVDTIYTEPFHISTQLATLDYVSGGRAGWIATASESTEAAAAVGRPLVQGVGLAQEAAASIEAGRRLWDSWEDDAVIRDVATGRYIDVNKLHYVDFETPADFVGRPYSVKGPAIIPRPPQGQLPVLAAASLVGEESVPVTAVDAVLVSAPTPELLGAEVRDVRARLGASIAVVAELDVVLDSRGQDAVSRVVPESGRAQFVGSPSDLTELLFQLLGDADGVRIHPAVLEVELDELARVVLPELRRRGALRAPVQDGTFRGLLGLGPAENRYSTSTSAASGAGK